MGKEQKHKVVVNSMILYYQRKYPYIDACYCIYLDCADLSLCRHTSSFSRNKMHMKMLQARLVSGLSDHLCSCQIMNGLVMMTSLLAISCDSLKEKEIWNSGHILALLSLVLPLQVKECQIFFAVCITIQNKKFIANMTVALKPSHALLSK